MNFIDNIEIKNFKSIRHQKIEGCKRINVFVGGPNIGKSNLLEAIGLFSINKDATNFCDFVRVGKCTTLFFNGNVGKSAQVIINNYFRAKIEYENWGLVASFQEDRFNNGFNNLDTETLGADIIEISDLSDKLLKKGQFLVSEKDKKIENYEGETDLIIYDSLVKDKVDKRGVKKIPILKYEFKKDVSYDARSAFRLNHPFGENIFEIISTKEELNTYISEILRNYGLQFLYDSAILEYKILKIVGNKIFTVPYSMTADTLQRLFFYKAATLSNKNAVLLFEEPEAHMFPPYVSKFTSDITNDENKNQFFITTHSPFVLNDLMANVEKDELAIYIVSYEKETGETQVHKMNDNDVQEAYQFGYDFFMDIDQFIPQKQHG